MKGDKSPHRVEQAGPPVTASVGLILLLAFTTSLAAQECGHQDVFGRLAIAAKNRLGESKIRLGPPDFRDTASVQRHLVFSSILGRLVAGELRRVTKDYCDAVVTPSLYPDLWALQIINYPSKDIDADKSKCATALRGVLEASVPYPEAIKRGGAEEGWIASRVASSATGFAMEASSVLTRALAGIYRPASAMHALMTVDPTLYRSLNSEEFVEWLGRQRESGSVGVEEIALCPSESASSIPGKSAANSALSNSPVLAAETLVQVHAPAGQTPTPTLRHVVIVGLKASESIYAGLNSPITLQDNRNPCDRPHTFVDPATATTQTVYARCLRQLRYGQPWILLFCDPKDCVSETIAAAFAAVVAKDPKVIELARTDEESKGPYVVTNSEVQK